MTRALLTEIESSTSQGTQHLQQGELQKALGLFQVQCIVIIHFLFVALSYIECFHIKIVKQIILICI